MREIKLRAYDKVLGMFDVLNVDFFYSTVLVVQQNNDTPEMDSQYYTLSIENANLQQFTGLKDKNGQEIYEGDILSCLGMRSRVVFENGVFWSRRLGMRGQMESYLEIEDSTVIGNIYENRDLLSAQEK